MQEMVAAKKQVYLKRRAKRAAQPETRIFMTSYLEHQDKTPILREALALRDYWNQCEIEYHGDELIVGNILSNEPVLFHYGCGIWISDECDWDDPAIKKIRETSYQYVDPSYIDQHEMNHIEAHASTSTWFGGHMVLDYERVLDIGLDGYRELVATYEQTEFYQALIITLEGITDFIMRYAKLAKDTELGAVLTHIAYAPPQTTHQAMQLIWILHYLDQSDAFGRFDYYLKPFIENDNLPKQTLTDLLLDFWFRIEDADQIQNMTIGGTNPDDSQNNSLITELILDVTKALAFKGPNLCLLTNEQTPDSIWQKAYECIGKGLGIPALYNEKVYLDSLTRHGYPDVVAKSFSLAGCSQIIIPGQSNFCNDIGLFNVAKILELTMYDGFDPRLNRQVGIRSGKVKDFKSFSDFLTAFYQQLDDAIAVQVSLHNKEIVYRANREGYALRSLFTADCIARGKGIFEGGAKYNQVQLEIIGMPNVADMLIAIKKAVYDDQIITFEMLLDILKNNWENHDEELEYFKNLPKFGNNTKEVDELRAEVSAFLYQRFNQEAGPLGGVYVPGEVIFTAYEACGQVIGATPDGRMSGQPLADSAAGAMGTTTNGPIALMHSVLSIPTKDYLLTTVVMNLRFLPMTFNNELARENLQSMMKAFFAQGGMQMQINVCDSKTLIAAQQNPELHGDLIVRVGGYSDYFVRLTKVLQDEIIARTEF